MYVYADHKDKYWMSLALKQAYYAFYNDEVPIGSVLIFKNKLVVCSFNKCKSMQNSMLHCELIVLNKACKIFGNSKLYGSSLYVTLEPCLMCLGAIINSGISKLVFSSFRKKEKSYNLYYKILKEKKILFYGGIYSSESSNIIENFFKLKR